MDEIDAALDFRNVSIVANYIKDRTKNAQFIIISLRYEPYLAPPFADDLIVSPDHFAHIIFPITPSDPPLPSLPWMLKRCGSAVPTTVA
jgi:hypothetical protein